jgi:serine/threonine protein kinase
MSTLGKYELHEKIGQGGFATIYRATHQQLQTEAAVKVLNPDRLNDPVARERLRREAVVASGLKHPNIVEIYDLVDNNETLAIAMELVSGGNLRQWIDQNHHAIGECLSILSQVAEALDYIHSQRYQSDRPLVHRDVKPENILLGCAPMTGELCARLSDFGLVWDAQQATALTQAGSIPGTIYYISPEQVEGLPQDILDGRADQYALGVVAYELLAGKRPFDGNDPIAIMNKRLDEAPLPPSQANPNLPHEFDEPLLQALSKAPEGRFATCRAFIRKLEEAWQASRLRLVRELIAQSRQAAADGDFKTGRQKLDEAAKLEPNDPRLKEALAQFNVQAERAQIYTAGVQNWQMAQQKGRAVLDLVPEFPDPKVLLVTLGVRPPSRPPFNLRLWLTQTFAGILLALPLVAVVIYVAVIWIVNR